MIGIYRITNKLNGKVYVGQSVDIEYRLKKHVWSHDNCAIHLAIQKYGKENFEFEVLEECSKEQLDEKEKYWITVYNSIVPNGYNITEGGDLRRQRSVQCYDEQGNFIKQYDSILEAARENKIDPSKISACCSDNTRFFAGPYQWKYTDDERVIQPKKRRKTRTIYQFDTQGNLLNTYSSLANAAQTLGVDKSRICACCNHRQKTAYGFQWSYEPQCLPSDRKMRPRKVNQYTTEGEYIATYDTLTAAAQAVGGTTGGVGAVCLGHSKTCKGFVFRYAD